MGQEQTLDEEQAKELTESLDRLQTTEKKKTAKADEKEEKRSEEPEKKSEEKKKGGAKRFFKMFFLALGVVLLLAVGVLGWFGFIPVLSNLLGAHNPRDLGVSYTEADLTSFIDKTDSRELDFADAPLKDNGKKTIWADPQYMDVELTSEEITAKVNSYENWVYMPVKNVQVRFSDGDIIEGSANLITEQVDEFVNFIGGIGYSQEDIQTGLDWLGRFAGDPAIYMKVQGKIIDNRVAFELLDAKIGRWTPPMGEASDIVYTGLINGLAGITGLDVERAISQAGSVLFEGTGPTTVYVKSN